MGDMKADSNPLQPTDHDFAELVAALEGLDPAEAAAPAAVLAEVLSQALDGEES